jgi:hypothetical protein
MKIDLDPAEEGAGRAAALRAGAESAPQLVLYDLESDPAETQGLSGRRPDIVDRLKPFLPPVGPYEDH